MKRWIVIALALCLALFAGIAGYFYSQSADMAPDGPWISQETPLLVQDVRVYDLDGRLAYRGAVDLAPELARIERGERDPHRNDGSVFQNREGRLPTRERGYYREYVVRTPTIRHAGPQRLVIGQGGEVYYTADHYQSFLRVQ